MDIKDFILVGGGLLIAAVVVHGFWIAWKARRDPLRMDLVASLPEADDEDDLRRLRAELPNGGARVIGRADEPWQGDLELERDTAAGGLPGTERQARPGPTVQQRKTEPRLDPLPEPRRTASEAGGTSPPVTSTTGGAEQPVGGPMAGPGGEPQATRPPAERRPVSASRKSAPTPSTEEAADPAAHRGKVKDVILPERGGRSDEPREPRRWPTRKPAAEPKPEQRPGGRNRKVGVQPAAEPRKTEKPVEELIVLNVLAPKGKPFAGPGVVEALRARGLRYGDMNIFHRVDPMTRASLYSVASVVEPGTFDLADLDNFRSPGVCFFLQLPGPEQPLEVFEDMLKAARDVAVRVGGEVKDEQRSVMTGQTVEHYRQRISDYCRRRMSMRA